MKAQREIELKDGPEGAAAYGGAKGILDFNFSLRCGQPLQFKESGLLDQQP